jgi:hypothetical protein
VDFDRNYQTKTHDELMQLAVDSTDLSPEAELSLSNELSKRGINRKEVEAYREEQRDKQNTQKTWNSEAVYSLLPSLGRIRATLSDWRKYKHQTGEWPYLSIVFCFLHLAIELLGLIVILWYGVPHGWSTGKLLLIVVPLILIDVLVSGWLEDKIRLSEIKRHRRKRLV